jgi:hypothetical protein
MGSKISLLEGDEPANTYGHASGCGRSGSVVRRDRAGESTGGTRGVVSDVAL